MTRDLRLRAPIGSPVGIVNNIVTFTGSTTVATSIPITIVELRAAAFEGGVSQLYNFPNSYFVTSTGDNFTLTIPSADDDFTRIRNTLSIIENGRMVLTNNEDGSKAFYSVSVTANDATNVVFALTALSSVAGNGMLGLAGRTVLPFNFSLPTTGSMDVFLTVNIEPRANRFIDHHDTPMDYNGRANQLVVLTLLVQAWSSLSRPLILSLRLLLLQLLTMKWIGHH